MPLLFRSCYRVSRLLDYSDRTRQPGAHTLAKFSLKKLGKEAALTYCSHYKYLLKFARSILV
uniref:Uncharacterized protein n=1 Tax=Arundo donax TaxID=35708 RepID=A0A0A9ABH1_ARUDO